MEENKIKTINEQEAGGVVFRKNNNKVSFLVIYRTKQKDWSFPKGHIEENETPEECALRETREETGWTGNIIDFIGDFSYESLNKERNILRKVDVRMFLVEPISQDISLIDSDEVESAKWIEFGDELLGLLSYPNQIELAKKAFLIAKNK